MEIKHSTREPKDGYISVRYRGYWFWIDDRDLGSKEVFATIMFLFTLTGSGEPENLPVVTFPAG